MPGALLYWGLSHRGRASATVADVMQLRIGRTGPGDGFGAPPAVWAMADTNAAWAKYNGTYTVPDGQTLTRFAFAAVTTATGDATVGNFLDDIVFTSAAPVLCPVARFGCCPSGPCALDVLRNATGFELRVGGWGNGPSGGALAPAPGGTGFVYTPATGFTGTDSLCAAGGWAGRGVGSCGHRASPRASSTRSFYLLHSQIPNPKLVFFALPSAAGSTPPTASATRCRARWRSR